MRPWTADSLALFSGSACPPGRSPDIRCCVKSLPRRPGESEKTRRACLHRFSKVLGFSAAVSSKEMPQSLDVNYAREVAETIYHPVRDLRHTE